MSRILVPGLTVKHKTFGEGRIEVCDNSILAVHFPKINDTKKLGTSVIFGNGLVTLESEEQTMKIKGYSPILGEETKIKTTISRTEEALHEYLEFLE